MVFFQIFLQLCNGLYHFFIKHLLLSGFDDPFDLRLTKYGSTFREKQRSECEIYLGRFKCPLACSLTLSSLECTVYLHLG
jgi:hypothetical protein